MGRLVKQLNQIHGEETFTVATSEEIWEALEAAEAVDRAELIFAWIAEGMATF